ncbi:PIG-L deacetylase family protein [Puniceicoccus vermicola]|uniref:PIG-L deacetylase family protein n=1 Tax=Puniceicoccus vermicola TaxID=388746 RepID=UPI001C8CC44E|nr:PIG-L deacetylase family protein [Puniceicoccus vermicola]
MNSSPPLPTVLAAVAHPDDIEFCFAGTLAHLKEVGCSVHMWNLANGCCGDAVRGREETANIRWKESRASAAVLGAYAHKPVFDDLAVFYDRRSLSIVSAVLRKIRPQIILTHSPNDYMEDHQNVCRLVVSAAFSRAMPNHITGPEVPTYNDPVRIYHAAPHGLHDSMGNPFQPDLFTDIFTKIPIKEKMLNCHRSQKEWLETTQGMGSYVDEMIDMGHQLAKHNSCRFSCAEGWRIHHHLGFCPQDYQPLESLLPDFVQSAFPSVYS